MRAALVLVVVALGGCALQPTFPDDPAGMRWRCSIGAGPCT